MKVMKFGGSSVGSAETIESVGEIIRESCETTGCAVVLSSCRTASFIPPTAGARNSVSPHPVNY